MPGYIEDRWYTKRPDPATGKRRETARHGQGKRWRVAGVPGVRDRSFKNLEGPGGAKAWLKEAATDTTRGAFYDPRDGAMTLDEYVREHWWPTLRRSPTTKESMERRVFNHILPLMGAMPLNRIGHDEIKQWLTLAERKKLDASTMRATWAHFSTILQAAHKAKRIPENPFRDPDLKSPTAPKSRAKAWPIETVAAVRQHLDARYQVLLDVAFCAGLRQGEAFALSPDDVEITGGEDDVIQVKRQVVRVNGKLAFSPPKGNKTREAPCPPELGHALLEHEKRFPAIAVTLPWVDQDRPSLLWEDRPLVTVKLYVTTPSSKDALKRDVFNDCFWKPALAGAGVIPQPVVERVAGKGKEPWRRTVWKMPREDGFHVLRHTFASVVLHEGETIGQLAEWLGHADPSFTLRTYVHFMPQSGKRAVATLGRLLHTAREGGATAAPADGPPGVDPPPFSPDSPQGPDLEAA
ncbi:site-specific integrase [Streptomyces sp. ISL-112]|uniref:tyrosine-type recombinase/integrase n=1 Tax=unclassified Streptomyces TaxID=2593676 RepID=UPI001BE9CEFA|nr:MULTISPECIES: site-specific integrase [unclassified Streptomyces]MBT2429378.1 site-specific integrase [Streptomyces sp. ISL-112]MBT2463970.1 site-specific integrase [Streptomyces sp. ISL-63]